MPYAAYLILSVLDWAAFVVGVFATIHSLLQRSDAYTVAERLTKPAWLAINAGATFAMWLFDFAGVGWMFWIAGLVAVLVYVVDVRPKLIEVQRGPRW